MPASTHVLWHELIVHSYSPEKRRKISRSLCRGLSGENYAGLTQRQVMKTP